MSDLLSTVQSSCQQALEAIKDFSAKTPGSLTSQAMMVGAVVGFITYLLRKKRYRLPPGPFAWPLLGNLLYLRNQTEPFFVTLTRWAKENYGPAITIYFGPLRCVTLNHVNVVTEALVQKGSDFAGRPYLYSLYVITEGYKDIAFASFTPAWKLHRKIAMQSLRHYMRGPHLEMIVHELMSMTSDKMAAEPGAFDPHIFTSSLMFHIIDTICFGEIKPLDDPTLKRFMDGFDIINSEIGNGFFEDIIPPLRFWPTKKFNKFVNIVENFLEYIYKNIDNHRKTFDPSHVRDYTDNILLAQSEAEREEKPEVMAMFTNTHVGETIKDIFAAGVDTSRMTLDWAILFVAGHPQVQKKAQAEIDSVTGTRMPGFEDRPKLQYTEAVLYEVMRLGTVGPLGLPHETMCDTSVGGYDVPKGTMVLFNLWAVLHDPETWDQPEEFRPERFLDENGKLRTKLENWVPFSAGPRACLGESVAKPELLLILSGLLKRFTISLPEGAAFDPSYEGNSILETKPKPYKIVITPRLARPNLKD